MKTFITILFLCCLFSLHVLAAGENCSSPIAVTAGCPAVKMINQSSAGMGNDINSWKYNAYYSPITLNGEDMVYEITFATGTSSILVSFANLNQTGYFFTSTDCSINASSIYTINSLYTYASNSNISIPAPSTGNIIYLYVDHSGSSNLTFDISFGSVTTGTYLNIPDTRGKLEFAKTNCVSPSFMPAIDLYRNGTQLTTPASFGTTNQPQEFCFNLFIQNLTGKEGIKSVRFTFRNTGFTNVNVTNPILSGQYASGTWNASITGNIVLWTFTNATNLPKGDNDEVTKSCMKYDFCMNATPINNTVQQLIDIWVTGDGFTPGYTGFQYSGCCASPNCTLYGASGYPGLTGTDLGATAAGAAGFGMGIGNAGLPVDLLEVWLGNQNSLHWKTTNEKKLAYYTAQYAVDGKRFEDLQKIIPTGDEQNRINEYEVYLDDYHLASGYLRIRSVDEDGTQNFSEIISYTTSSFNSFEVLLSPNPVEYILHIQSTEELQSMALFDLNGTPLYSQSMGYDEHIKEMNYDFTDQPKGIYTLQVLTNQGILHKRVVKD